MFDETLSSKSGNIFPNIPLYLNLFKNSRFEPKGGASLKQRSRKKIEGIVKRGGKAANKKADSEKALKKALNACLKNGWSMAEIDQIVYCESVKNQKK